LFFAAELAGLDFTDVIGLVDALEEVRGRAADLDDLLRPEDAALQ
jgi:hypothetical protein